eukprot:7047070-Pyramimonas_sp.AAC.1
MAFWLKSLSRQHALAAYNSSKTSRVRRLGQTQRPPIVGAETPPQLTTQAREQAPTPINEVTRRLRVYAIVKEDWP